MDWPDQERAEFWVGSLLALVPWLYYLAKQKKQKERLRKMIVHERPKSSRKFEDWFNLVVGCALIAMHSLVAVFPGSPVGARVLSGVFALGLSYVWRTSTV